jgi:SAM-dependent methyltransferase
MLLGTRDPFVYAECGQCLSVQLVDHPSDLGAYYPDHYYSFQPGPRDGEEPRWTKKALAGFLVGCPLPGAGVAAALLKESHPLGHWARISGARRSDAILDVGCGHGTLLRRMRRWGFTNLSGIDPGAREELRLPGLTIRRAQLADIDAQFDLIMLHHVLEHVPDPAAMLRLAAGRLGPGGRILVRLPLAASYAARQYGGHWFALDPPRHLAIPSRRGFDHLVRRAGLTVRHHEFDGTALTFEMSELYRRDVPFIAVPDIEARVAASPFRALVRRLNRTGEADTGVFVLTPG